MNITRVTAGIDHSECSARALAWAAKLASSLAVDLRAVSAWQRPLIAMLPESVGALPTDEYMTESTEALLAKVTAEVGVDDCEQVAVQGAPGPVLVDESAPDAVIVLGRHGSGQRHGLARFVDFMLGSAAHHTVHHAEGPVAILPNDAEWVEHPHVLVGVDGSSSSLEALAWAIDNLPADSRITALYTIIPWGGDPLAPVDATFNPQIIASAEAELAGWVETVVAGCERSDASVEAKVEIGAARFTMTSPSWEADIIVVGHQGRSGIAAKLLGSVADHVVRHAEVPAIVVRHPAD